MPTDNQFHAPAPSQGLPEHVETREGRSRIAREFLSVCNSTEFRERVEQAVRFCAALATRFDRMPRIAECGVREYEPIRVAYFPSGRCPSCGMLLWVAFATSPAIEGWHQDVAIGPEHEHQG